MAKKREKVFTNTIINLKSKLHLHKLFNSILNNQQNILVTGASGLVGSHLVKKLLDKYSNVKAIYRSEIPDIQCKNKIEWIKADILDINSLETAIENVSEVYHCAAVVSFMPKEKNKLLQTNIEGTANVVNASLNSGVKKLVYVSSVSALGRIREDVAVNETMNWTPETSNSIYGKSKYLAEMEVWRGIGEGLDAVIVNPTIILGANDWSKTSAAIFKNVYKEFPWYTEGVTGFVDVEDVASAMIMLMESSITAQRFILSAQNITYKELFTEIAKAFNKKPPYKKVSPLIAQIVWRLEAIRSKFTGKKPLITKETARTAQAKVNFDNSKLLQYLPQFTYTPLQQSVKRICNEYIQKYKLS